MDVVGIVSRTLNLIKKSTVDRVSGVVQYAGDEVVKTYKGKTAPPPNCGSCRFAWSQKHPVGVVLTMCLHPMRPERVHAVNHQIPPLPEECPQQMHRAKGTFSGELLHLLSLRLRPSFDDDRTFHQIRRMKELYRLIIFGEDPEQSRAKEKAEKDAKEAESAKAYKEDDGEDSFAAPAPTQEPSEPTISVLDPALRSKYGFFFDKGAIPAFEHQASTAEHVLEEIKKEEPPPLSPEALADLKQRMPFFFDKNTQS